MATYNGEQFILEQIQSILSQLEETDELIISDDISSDKTLDIIMNVNDNRIKILSGIKHSSLIFNFENALKHATGDYIFLSDQDDVWLPNKISTMKHFLETYDLVVSNVTIVDSSLKVIKKAHWDGYNPICGFFYNLYKNPYLGCSMAFRSEILKCVLPFPKGIPMHDIWIGLCTHIFKKQTHYIAEPLMLYRRHGNNASFTSEHSSFSIIKKISYRLQVIYYLFIQWNKYSLKKIFKHIN